MVHENEDTFEFTDDDLIEASYEIYDDDDGVSALPAWIMSIAVHSILALIFAGIIYGQLPEKEDPPIRRIERVAIVDVQKPVEDLPDIDPDITDPVETPETDVSVVTDLDIVIDPVETEDETETELESEVAVQSDLAVMTQTDNAKLFMMAIGVGNSSPFSSRRGPAKNKALNDGNAPREIPETVNNALLWFKKHQTTDGIDAGLWDVDGYMAHCQDGVKCEPGTAHTTAGGDGDSACTGYALLCFLGAGYDHKTPGKFKKTIALAVDWLKRNQREDGGFGKTGRNYENAVCTKAICEAYAMTMDVRIKECAQRAVDNLLNRQAKTDTHQYGLGWNYAGAQASRNDSSVTGWCIMALKSAKSAGLNVGNGWEGAKQWVDRAWVASNPGVDVDQLASGAQSTFCYTYDANANTAKGNKLECVGALSAIFLGKRQGDGMLDSLMQTIMDKQVPQSYPCNTYYMYYNALNAFQYGGAHWEKWNQQVSPLLINAQHGAEAGCFAGSWDYEGTQFHGHETGRLLSTAYCCLSLQVYYIYQRVRK